MRASFLFAFQSPATVFAFATSRYNSGFARQFRKFTSTKFKMASSSTSSSEKNLVVDPFCFRQFAETDASKSYGGTVFDLSISEFEDIVNNRYEESNLKDGYAPFCKHIFLVNDFTDARVNVLPLNEKTIPLVRTSYEARNDKELPVLQRFIPIDLIEGGPTQLPIAKYLDLILYSREQIQKENTSMLPGDETAPWGVVSIKAQDVDYELPMNPSKLYLYCDALFSVLELD